MKGRMLEQSSILKSSSRSPSSQSSTRKSYHKYITDNSKNFVVKGVLSPRLKQKISIGNLGRRNKSLKNTSNPFIKGSLMTIQPKANHNHNKVSKRTFSKSPSHDQNSQDSSAQL